MRSRIAVRGVLLVLALLVATPLAAEAQPKDSLPRVGHLFVIPSSATAHLREAFRQGLRELGYVEGQNLIIEFRSADGRAERLPELATELVRLRVDVIVAAPDVSIRAAQLATRTIPIVMAVSLDDPVEQRFVASLARPGGNVTGLSTLHEGLGAKRLELLKAVVPKLARVAVLWEVDNSSQAAHLRIHQAPAPTSSSLTLRGSGRCSGLSVVRGRLRGLSWGNRPHFGADQPRRPQPRRSMRSLDAIGPARTLGRALGAPGRGVALRNRCPQGQADPRAAIDGGASGVTMARAGPHPRRARHSGQRARGTDG